MILTRDAILREIRAGRIKISPFKLSSVGPASIDLSLGKKLRIFTKPQSIKVSENTKVENYTTTINISKGYALAPGELVLGVTEERVRLADNICGWIHSRSRFARLGFMTHITAPFLQPGINNHQVLEIFNASHNVLIMKPGVQVCSIVLSHTDGHARYKGQYKDQHQP